MNKKTEQDNNQRIVESQEALESQVTLKSFKEFVKISLYQLVSFWGEIVTC